MIFRLHWFLLTMILWSSALLASPVATPALSTAPTPDAGVEHVMDRKSAAYAEVLAAYDAALLESPEDVATAVARCHFVARFIDNDYGDWIDSAHDEYERCRETLAADHADAPAAQLFALNQLWGDEQIALGETMLSNANGWPTEMRRELLATLSQAHGYNENQTRAGQLAVLAAELGDTKRIPTAVAYLAASNRTDEAVRLLREAPVATNQYEARQRVEAALDLPNSDVALQEWSRHQDAGLEFGLPLQIRAHLHAGDAAMAAGLLESAGKGVFIPAQVRFDVAMATGDHRAAAATVDLSNIDAFGQNLTRFAMLVTAAPTTLLSSSGMLLGLVVCILLLACLALVPGIMLIPVHYRGLVRRLKGKQATPLFEQAGLRHAWFALALLFCVPTVVMLLLEPAAAITLFGGETLPDAHALSRMMLWSTVVGLAFTIPLFRRWEARQLIGDRTTLRAWWRVLLAWVVLIGVGFTLGLWHANNGGAPETMQTLTIDAIASSASHQYGLFLILFLMVVLVPIFEELVYRGLLLGGLSRHISFGWANLLQAIMFAASHDDWPRFPFYLVLGLLAGWLVKRTGALSPAIALHALNNLLAFAPRML